MAHEEFRILVLRAGVCVGIEDELGVRKLLLQDERVHGVDGHGPAAVHDQRRLADRLQIFERLLPRCAPLPIASIWAAATFSLTSGSRFSARSRKRLRNSRPTAWLFSDFVKCTRSQR